MGFPFKRVNPTRADLYYKCTLVIVQSASGENVHTKAQIRKLTWQRHPIVGHSSPFVSLVVFIQRCACAWVHLLRTQIVYCPERRGGCPPSAYSNQQRGQRIRCCVCPYIGLAQSHLHISTSSTFAVVKTKEKLRGKKVKVHVFFFVRLHDLILTIVLVEEQKSIITKEKAACGSQTIDFLQWRALM